MGKPNRANLQPGQIPQSVSSISQGTIASVVNNLTSGFIVIDQSWRIRYINLRAAQDADALPDQVTGCNIWDTWPILTGTPFHSHSLQVMESRVPAYFEMQNKLRGEWYQVSIYPCVEGVSIHWLDITARKQIEIEYELLIHENQQQSSLLAAIFDADPSGLAVVTGLELRFAYVNPIFRMLCPVLLDDFSRQPYEAAWPSPEWDQHRGRIATVLDTGKPFQVTGLERVFSKDSSRIFTLQARRIEWDSCLAVLLIFWDTTDTSRAEAAARLSQERYALLFNSLTEGFALHEMVYDDQGNPVDYRFLEVNPAFERFTGLSPQQVLGRTVLEVLPQTEPYWIDTYARVATTGEPIQFENFSGSLDKYYQVNAFCPEKGKFAVLFTDVTQRKQTEIALRQSEARLNRSQEIAHLGSWELDLATGQLTWSDEAYRIFGLQPQEFGASYPAFLEAVHPDDRLAVDAAYTGSLRDGRDSYEIEHRVVRKSSGEVRFVHEKCEHIRDQSGQIIRSVGMVQDITERKQVEQALQASQAQLNWTIANSLLQTSAQYKKAHASISGSPHILTTPFDLRHSGIDVIGPIPWGTHFCQFYATSQDLVETLVPYFRAGLIANEFCMWITSAPLQVDQALEALRFEVPDLDTYLNRGQIEILDYTQWYTLGGTFEAESVLQGWTDKLTAAQQKGFAGLRLTGNTFWLEKTDWEDFTRYEEMINEVIGGQNMIALCTYSLEKCGMREIMDVVANHQFALIKTAGQWEVIESAAHKMMEYALRESQERFQLALRGAPVVVFTMDKELRYTWIYNPMFGLSVEDVIGHRDADLFPPEAAAQFTKLHRSVLESGQTLRQEVSFNMHGSPVFFDVTIEPLRDAHGAMTGIAAAALDLTSLRQAQAEALENAAHLEVQRRLIEQREQERLQIARDLHDGPVQDLLGVSFAVQALLDRAQDPETLKELEFIRMSVQTMADDLRGYTSQLRPHILVKFGLISALRAHINTFLERRPEIIVTLDLDDRAPQLPETVELALYRIHQEAFNNIVKHAAANQVWVKYHQQNSSLLFEVRDNGKGFSVPSQWLTLARQGHLGLVGIIERTEAIGGKAEITSSPNAGTHLIITLPQKPL